MAISWELFVGPFSGVLLAFVIARSYDWWKNRREKTKLLHSLRRELEQCVRKMDGKARLVPIDMWRSAMGSGKVNLLSLKQMERLGRVYHTLSNHNYASKDLWKVSIKAKIKKDRNTVALWTSLSEYRKEQEEQRRAGVIHLLEEEWWPD
ncbi:MAG: hypothetical protein ACFE7I_09825 [Candidatus Hodarchaeota archaeon]